MSYGLYLVRLPTGVDPYEAYELILENQERTLEREPGNINPGPIDPQQEQLKQRIASTLMARHPTLKMYRRDYSGIAKARGIDETEAHRLFRDMELNEDKLHIQITLFDDAAGVSFSYVGKMKECTHALRVLWDCLEILESEGGFSTYDTQMNKILELKFDFENVLKYACGVDRFVETS